ncbi:MAG: proteasome-activating nucleotidase [Candidatus Lokiarchaeota archaeon]|nr:proteasome-activating nucleotidase [Candidatus Lokiarchaeota archaeon]
MNDNSYLISYTKKLEKKIRALETERQIYNAEKMRLERELHALKSELERMRKPPLVTAEITDILPNKTVIVRSSTGPTFLVNVAPDIDLKDLKVGGTVALNQRTFSILKVLHKIKDPFVKAMEVEEAPEVTYDDVGGLEEQKIELKETVELPLDNPEIFEKVGIEPPKGVLLYGPPGTGKTMLAKAVAKKTRSTFIRVIGSELVQKFIGEGARMVREVFNLAREKAPSIVFIDELDAIGCKRIEVATSGDREVQRTLMQLLSILDGFDSRGDVRIIAATNRIDIIDRALLRPGRFDRLIEFDYPTDEERRRIFEIYTNKLNLEINVDIERLVELTKQNFDRKTTGADIKAIVMEAGMFAIRNERYKIDFKDFEAAIRKVLRKEKNIGRIYS